MINGSTEAMQESCMVLNSIDQQWGPFRYYDNLAAKCKIIVPQLDLENAFELAYWNSDFGDEPVVDAVKPVRHELHGVQVRAGAGGV